MQTMKTTMDRGTTAVEIIYAVGASDDGKSIVAATVKKQDHLNIEITSRRGDKLNVSPDALDTLIIALQAVQTQMQRGTLK